MPCWTAAPPANFMAVVLWLDLRGVPAPRTDVVACHGLCCSAMHASSEINLCLHLSSVPARLQMEPHPKPEHVPPRESKRARGASADAADATDDTRPEQSILAWAQAAAMDAVYNFGVVAGQTVDTMSAAATAAWARAACTRAHGDEDDNEDDDDDLIHAEEWEAGDIHSECGHCADGVGR